MKFGEKLKTARINNGLSQEQLAECVDVSRQTVSKWENNECYPTVEKLLILAEKLGVSLDWLFDKI